MKQNAIILVVLRCSSHPVELRGMNGSFTSPDYPGHYPNNARWSWQIVVPPGYNVRLSFYEFRTEEWFDRVRIVSKSVDLDQRYSGRVLIPTLHGGREVIVTFVSDASVTDTGFRAEYRTVPGASATPSPQPPAIPPSNQTMPLPGKRRL